MSEPVLRVVPIREGAPALTDVPGQLRNLADRIEKGLEPHGFTYGIFIGVERTERTERWSRYGWGELPNSTELTGILTKVMLAQANDCGQERDGR